MKSAILKKLREHPDAPAWNHSAGDKLTAGDLRSLKRFREDLRRLRPAGRTVPDRILSWVRKMRKKSGVFRRIPAFLDLRKEWSLIPTMSREDLALRPESVVPDDADLDKLIVYRTAGTSGHALLVPHEARAVACYTAFIDHALSRYGVRPGFGPGRVGCFLVGAQARTVTYPTVLSAWKGAGFAKLNLNPAEWPKPDSAKRYFADMAPAILTGDPISFAEMLRLGIRIKPLALISTAVAMSRGLKIRLEKRYGCPVIDWYSLTETGPLGYACSKGHGYHVLPRDVYLEALGSDGRPVSPGKRGEITVTGGRNPFVPLLRYRTGDWGRIDHRKCPCKDPAPRLLDLEGRPPVLFRAKNGAVVNPVDVSRVLREFPLVQHEFSQNKDLSCDLVIRPVDPSRPPSASAVRRALTSLFGKGTRIRVRFDPKLGNRSPGGKAYPFRSRL